MCAKLFFSMYVCMYKMLSGAPCAVYFFLILSSSLSVISNAILSDQTLRLDCLALLLLYIRSGDTSEDRGNDTTLTDSLFTYVCMYVYV